MAWRGVRHRPIPPPKPTENNAVSLLTPRNDPPPTPPVISRYRAQKLLRSSSHLHLSCRNHHQIESRSKFEPNQRSGWYSTEPAAPTRIRPPPAKTGLFPLRTRTLPTNGICLPIRDLTSSL